jgi:hypothetical protein
MTTDPTNDPSDRGQEIASQIALALGEMDAAPLAQLRQIVRLCGAEQALAWLRDAQAIEAAGGTLTEDGMRRRTFGGIYFKIVRDALLASGRKDQVAQIFWRNRKQPNTDAHPVPSAPSATWADRGVLIAEIGNQPGKAHTVKVTLIGKPGKVVARDDFTLLVMTHSGPLPALPKGIPVPAKVPETRYIVYVGGKQWRGVAEAIKNPEDVLIVEGTQFFDAEHTAIAIFATSVTTKALQQAKRQAQINQH